MNDMRTMGCTYHEDSNRWIESAVFYNILRCKREAAVRANDVDSCTEPGGTAFTQLD